MPIVVQHDNNPFLGALLALSAGNAQGNLQAEMLRRQDEQRKQQQQQELIQGITGQISRVGDFWLQNKLHDQRQEEQWARQDQRDQQLRQWDQENREAGNAEYDRRNQQNAKQQRERDEFLHPEMAIYRQELQKLDAAELAVQTDDSWGQMPTGFAGEVSFHQDIPAQRQAALEEIRKKREVLQSSLMGRSGRYGMSGEPRFYTDQSTGKRYLQTGPNSWREDKPKWELKWQHDDTTGRDYFTTQGGTVFWKDQPLTAGQINSIRHEVATDYEFMDAAPEAQEAEVNRRIAMLQSIQAGLRKPPATQPTQDGAPAVEQVAQQQVGTEGNPIDVSQPVANAFAQWFRKPTQQMAAAPDPQALASQMIQLSPAAFEQQWAQLTPEQKRLLAPYLKALRNSNGGMGRN